MAREIGVVLYDGFETLDVYGPLGLLCYHTSPTTRSPFEAVLLKPPNTEVQGEVQSSSNLSVETYLNLGDPSLKSLDILLIPGGYGNRVLLKDGEFLLRLREVALAVLQSGGVVFCVCTGSILLAATGLLDGVCATTNKIAYDALTPNYPNVRWKRNARWVVEGRIITSSGITAGMVCLLILLVLEVQANLVNRMLHWIC